MKRATFRQKLWLPRLASLLCLGATALFCSLQARYLRLNERKASLAAVDKSALSIVPGLAAEAAAGNRTVPPAQLRTGIGHVKTAIAEMNAAPRRLSWQP